MVCRKVVTIIVVFVSAFSSSAGANELWTEVPYYGTRATAFADVTGDGKADAIVVNDDKVVVRRSDGTKFQPNEGWTEGAYYGSRGTFFADVTGDGKADAIVVNDDAVVVRRSDGGKFQPNEVWAGPYYGSRGTFFADVTGDGKADAIVVNDDGVVVRRSDGGKFQSNEVWTGPFYGSLGTFFADVTGDGKVDPIGVNDDKVRVVVRHSDQNNTPSPSPIFNSHLNSTGKPLRGFVDLHTHPMAHLGFGGHVVHGAPDVGVLMPADMIYEPKSKGVFDTITGIFTSVVTSGTMCNTTARTATKMEEAMGSSNSTHGGYGAEDNDCGNSLRKGLLSEMEKKYHSDLVGSKATLASGYPQFTNWPAYNDILHQQMWWEWIKRAKEGGLRVMVALAVNNFTLATALQPNKQTPIDDQSVGNVQIDELKKFVSNHQDFMQIAHSPQELRRIVESDKLAIVIGIELDDIGNMLKVSPTPDMVRHEIRRLYDLGVRYAFPVHVIDNHFGGTAAYETEFALANRFQAGHWLDLTCSGGEGITKRIKFDEVPLEQLNAVLKIIPGIGGQSEPNCAAGEGYKNKLGLKPLGYVALDEMMSLGMLIDIDHMSQQTANGTLRYTADRTGKIPADQYPIVSGHNALRVPYNSHSVSFNDHDSENQRTTDQYQDIAARGGIAGVGFGKSNARTFIEEANAVAALGVPVNFGSDINGLVSMPRSPSCQTTPCIQYSPTFPQARMGEKVWDYNRDGVAHIGLFPDFLKHVENLPGGPPLVDKLYNGAEAFARMWEKAAQISKKIALPSSPTRPTTPVGPPPGEGPTRPDCPPSLPRCQPK